MENYTKRSKNILSLTWFYFSLVLTLSECGTKAQILAPIPQKVEAKINTPDTKYDNVLYWSTNEYYPILKNNKAVTSIENVSMIRKKYSIKNGKLYSNGKLLDRVYINFNVDDNYSKSIIIEKGLPDDEYLYHIKEVPSYLFSDNGGMVPMKQQLNIFKTGSGYWIDTYVVEYFKNKDYDKPGKKATIKEEGKVKNNYKVGEWKYYNKEGKIDSVKTYTLKDAVDVRFPHCIFNKNEPCY
ncbi:hypothetical protein C1637_23180 [Chryseobacterium lactis]|uniref:Lipoprotein n=1 Tax=Chryseobacterium lactis TaxID=1241981 RepID=A0A3G6RE78_CHRLC|nr:hypothetical protein [Chryseobacterium lactis]AZA82743.1 hypothetical protein EG342_13045 [Chryseobacterium lactis]AZB03125.1 hypothetical protein EG341_03910 [Chryseobacterium lactis]PNW11194.1 hypothetical protein C1637_23180 [Chryseobacterium lactis]